MERLQKKGSGTILSSPVNVYDKPCLGGLQGLRGFCQGERAKMRCVKTKTGQP
jgi:hypothetical protein